MRPPEEYLKEQELREQLEQLKADNRKLLQQLARAKAKTEDLVAAVHEATRIAVRSMHIPAVPAPATTVARSGPEVANIHLGDWQLAKITQDYDSDVCEERLELLGRKIIDITNLHRTQCDVDELRVWCLGDMVEGELIFPGQAHLIDASLFEQVTKRGTRLLFNFCRRMLGYFARVRVVCVEGNHGSLGGKARKEYRRETNADRMLYQQTANLFEVLGESRIQFHIPQGGPRFNPWYAVDYVGTYGTLLFHGNQLAGPTGAQWAKKLQGWQNGAVPEPFRDAAFGHHHRLFEIPFGTKSVARGNGSTESYNAYAQESFASMSDPVQRFQFIKPDFGPTAEYKLWLDGRGDTVEAMVLGGHRYVLDRPSPPVTPPLGLLEDRREEPRTEA